MSVLTVYRDVLALNESGVPVVSVPGRGYRLMDGYFLPPLHFTPQEAVLLMLGAGAVARAFDAEYADAATSALNKLQAALPDEKRAEVQFVREHLQFVPPDETVIHADLRALRGAVLGRQVVTSTYHKPQGEQERREAYPLGLVHLYGAWLLSAFDPARGATRVFRLSRMEGMQVSPQTFQRDPAWMLRPTDERGKQRNVSVRLLLDASLSRAVRERPHFFQTAEQLTASGLEVSLQVRDIRDVLPWVLSWGAGVQVLEPASLRDRVREEALKMAARHS